MFTNDEIKRLLEMRDVYQESADSIARTVNLMLRDGNNPPLPLLASKKVSEAVVTVWPESSQQQPLDSKGQIPITTIPITQTIRNLIDGTRTAIEIADEVEKAYPERERATLRSSVSTIISQLVCSGKYRKSSTCQVFKAEPSPDPNL